MKKTIDKLDIRQAKDELLRLTKSFCDKYLDDEYGVLSKKMIDKLSRKRQVPYLFGRLEIWAGGIINALGTINFLFDNRSNHTSHLPKSQSILELRQAH